MSRIALAPASAVVIALCSAASLSAQAAPAPTTPPAAAAMEEHHATGSGWKELDDFHKLMAATWHPVSRNNDLSVIRQKADSLLASAKTWKAAPVPHACHNETITNAINDVVKGAEKVAQLVSSRAADAEVRAALSDVHTRFEVVEEGCQPSSNHH